jgi:hypothetical protein
MCGASAKDECYKGHTQSMLEDATSKDMISNSFFRMISNLCSTQDLLYLGRIAGERVGWFESHTNGDQMFFSSPSHYRVGQN